MNAVEAHPQRQEIIGQMLNGVPMRQIAATISPAVHHATLARFRLKMLATTAKNMRGSSPTALAVKGIGDPAAVPDLRASVRNEIESELAQRRSKRAQREASAESAQQIDPITGEVRHNMDHAALGRYDANGLRDIELRAKLAGLLETGDSGTTTLKAVVMMPGPSSGAPLSQPVAVLEQDGTVSDAPGLQSADGLMFGLELTLTK